MSKRGKTMSLRNGSTLSFKGPRDPLYTTSWEALTSEQIRDDLMASIAGAFQIPEHMLRGEPAEKTLDLVKQPDGSWA